jgi:hypothetical protein
VTNGGFPRIPVVDYLTRVELAAMAPRCVRLTVMLQAEDRQIRWVVVGAVLVDVVDMNFGRRCLTYAAPALGREHHILQRPLRNLWATVAFRDVV